MTPADLIAQRFTMWCAASHGHAPQEHPAGEFVLYTDHVSALTAQAERIAVLEAAVRKWASECGGCGGTGVHQIATDCIGGDIFPVTEPCPDCADIRAVIAKATGETP